MFKHPVFVEEQNLMMRFFSTISKATFSQMANVKRMDTHGNIFVVAENIPYEKAKQIENEMEARGHKQAYWTEEISDSKPEDSISHKP